MLQGGNVIGVSVPATVATVKGRVQSRQFYVRMAYLFAFIAIAGFVPTYWAPVARGTFAGAPILHLHGLLFTAWTLLFLAQARFASAGRFEHHRMLGLAGISVATGMLFFGLAVAINAIQTPVAGFEQHVREFSIVPITLILFFGAVVGFAIAHVRRPEVHMRLMIVASITIMPPAIARVVFMLLAPEGAPGPGSGVPPPVVMSLIPGFLSNLLLIPPMVHDWRTRGRPHPVYLIAGAALVIVQIVRVPLASTGGWHALAGWLSRLGG